MTEGLPKEQRLYKKKDIQTLFEKGKGFLFYPFRVVVFSQKTEDDESSIPRIVISVSKKRFHHAVKRNRVKRLIRETWRKNKAEIMIKCKEQKKTLDIAFIYVATVILSYEEIEKKIKQLSLRLEERYLKDEKNCTPAG